MGGGQTGKGGSGWEVRVGEVRRIAWMLQLRQIADLHIAAPENVSGKFLDIK